MESEVIQDLAGEEDAPELTRLLSAEITDGNPDAFGENVEILLSIARESKAEPRLGTSELKVLLRRLGHRFEVRSGNQVFSRGVYQTFFSGVRAGDEISRQALYNKLGILVQLSSLLENRALTVQSLRPILLRLWGELTRGISQEEADRPNARLLPWMLFEALLRGVLRMETFSTAERSFHYAVLVSPEQFQACLKDERRQVLLGDLRFSLGDAFPRRPALGRLLQCATALAPMDRALLVQAIRSRRPGEVDPFAQLLRHHAFVLAMAEEDLREPYFTLLDELLLHLLTGVLSEVHEEMGMVLRVYLTLLRERHIPALRRWCATVRGSRAGAELFADLLYEPYLLRMGLLAGGREPSILALVQDWMTLQQVMERQGGYSGEPFSLPDRLRVLELDWLRSRRPGPEVADDPELSCLEAPSTQPCGRRALGKTISDYDTFVRLPVMPGLATSPEGELWPVTEEPGMDPFAEDATTERYEVPDGPGLFDAITRRLPSLGTALLMDVQSGALLIPTEEGRAGALYRASTVILPSPEPGAEEEGLHQSTTLIFPVQSVPVTRNEAICRRLDVLMSSEQSMARRSSERLRREIVGMPDEDRIIAEQYLAQVIERRMGGIAARVNAVRGMSMVTLDNFVGSLLSAVLRDVVVTGYLRRVFVAECASLQSTAAGEEPFDSQVVESLQLALFTVLNAHQDRVTLPGDVEKELRSLAGWPATEPIPSRLPYHLPDRLSVTRHQWARIQGAGSSQLLFDAEHLFTDHLSELDRVVDRVNTLELFLDVESALGSEGFGPEAYLALVAGLRDRLRQIVDRARGLFVGLDEVGSESVALERLLLEFIAYGRTVWSRCVFPALVFYAKMAFGVREEVGLP